jgi:hypothetical protein
VRVRARWGISVAFAAVVALVVPPSAGAQAAAETYSGAFRSIDGESLVNRPPDSTGRIARNAVEIHVAPGQDGQFILSGDFVLALEGQAFDSDNNFTNLICVSTELHIANVGVTNTQSPDEFGNLFDLDVDAIDNSAADHGCDGAPGPAKSVPASMHLEVVGGGVAGTISVQGERLEFDAGATEDTATTDFLQGTALSPEVKQQTLTVAECTADELANLPAPGFDPISPHSADCRAAGNAARDFRRAFSSSFKNDAILQDLADVVLLRTLKKPDGSRAMPSLTHLTKVIALLAIKADSEKDNTALTAMRRLIAIAVANDLDAVQ